MRDTLALIVIILVGCYFITLAVIAFTTPERASRFLLGFADSAATHYLELTLRLIVGAAFLLRAPLMPLACPFTVFGWLLIGTTACLFLVPWQWHRRFTLRAVPQALRYLKLIAFASLIVGSAILAAAYSTLLRN